MKKQRILYIAIILVLMVSLSSGCKKSSNTSSFYNIANITNVSDTSGFLNFTTPKKGDQVATIETSMGNITVMFFKSVAPKATQNFITLAQQGYYNNVVFHRVMNNFMIQGGDPTGTGMGGQSIWGKFFANEISTKARSFRGALCMANEGDSDSNGSQFYIVQAGTSGIDDRLTQAELSSVMPITQDAISEYKKVGGYPSLDGGYTVFGQVTSGMDVVDKIAAVSVDSGDKPLTPITMLKVEVETVK